MNKLEKSFILAIAFLLVFIGLSYAQSDINYSGRPGSDGRAGNDYQNVVPRTLDLNVNVKMPEMERIIQNLSVKLEEASQQKNKKFQSDDLEDVVNLVRELEPDCICEQKRENDLREVKLNAQELSSKISRGGARTINAADLNKFIKRVLFVKTKCDCEVARQQTIKDLQREVSSLNN